MQEIEQILRRHKVPGVYSKLENAIEPSLTLLDDLEDIVREEERTEDGMHWVNVLCPGYISGLGYSPDLDTSFMLAVYDFLVSNEFYQGEPIEELNS
jgi:hypothetical protein